jgi:hypothetical protein
MENRARLWESFKEKLGYVGIGLLLTLGFPLVARLVVKVTSPRLGFLATLERIGWVYVWVAPLLLIGLTWWSWHSLRARQRQMNTKIATQGETYLLLPRPDAAPIRAGKVALWQRLSQVLPRGEHLSFELTGTPQGQAFSLRASDTNVCRAALVQVMTEYPGVEVSLVETATDDPLWVGEGQVSVWMELRPIHVDQPLLMATPDPQLAILGELALLPQNVQGGVQVLMREDFHTRGRLMSQAAKATSKKPDTGPHTLRPSSADKREVTYVDTRAQQHFVEVQLLVWAAAPLEGMAWQVVNHLADTLQGQYQPHNPLRIAKQGAGNRYERSMPPFGGVGWATSELGTLAHLVGSDSAVLAPQLLRARARALPASPKSYIPSYARLAPFLTHAQPLHLSAAALADLVVIQEEENA